MKTTEKPKLTLTKIEREPSAFKGGSNTYHVFDETGDRVACARIYKNELSGINILVDENADGHGIRREAVRLLALLGVEIRPDYEWEWEAGWMNGDKLARRLQPEVWHPIRKKGKMGEC